MHFSFRLPPVHRLALALAVLPAVVLAVLVVRYWVNLPVSDEWTTSVGYTLAKAREGTLSVPYLFSQHTESRPVFPRLVALVLNAGGGPWDVRRGMVLNLALAASISALFWRLLGRDRPAWSRLLALAAMNVLLFSPVGWEIWLWGQGYLVLLGLLCLAGILVVNASDASLRRKAAMNAVLAFIGTFSFANGLLLWFLGWPGGRQKAEGRRLKAEGGVSEKDVARDPLPSAFYVASALASFGLFFAGYRTPDPAALPYALGHPGETVRFFLAWCAGPLLPGGNAAPPHAGHLVLGAALVGAFAAGVVQAWRLPGARPWVLLGTFALVSGALAATGRTRTGVEFALSSRYAVTAVLLPVATVGTWWTLITAPGGGGRGAGLREMAVLLAVVLHVRAFAGSVERMRGAREAREKARDALTFINLMPDNPQFRPIFPDLDRHPGALRVAFHRLRAAGLLTTPVSSPALEEALGKAAPDGVPGPPGGGAFDACAPRNADQLVVSGWASDPATTTPGERPAPFVVFQWTPLDAAGNPAGPPRPWTTLRADRERPDVAKALGRYELTRSGFVEAIYRPLSADGAGAGRVSAWAVHPAAGKVRPLTNAFTVPAATAP